MTVKELIKRLQTQDPDRLVIMASDSEGNDFAALAEEGSFSCCRFDGERTGLEELTEWHKERGYTEEDVMTTGKPALVLWP
jgi:hypothetical protein